MIKRFLAFFIMFSTCLLYIGCANQEKIDSKTNIKIMSYNVQHCVNSFGDGDVDYNRFAEVIKEIDPDIIGLNEIYYGKKGSEFGNQTKILADKCKYKFYKFGKACQKDDFEYGNGFMSKITTSNIEVIPIPVLDGLDKYEPRCIIKAELKNGLTILISHFGLSLKEVECAVETVLPLIKNEKCILMGDFNVTPENKLLNPIREKMKDTADLFEGERLSWPSYDPDRKLDYIFVSSDIKVIKSDIPSIKVSDHLPYVVEIEL